MPAGILNQSSVHMAGFANLNPPTYNTLRRPGQRDNSYNSMLEKQLNDKDEIIMKLKSEFNQLMACQAELDNQILCMKYRLKKYQDLDKTSEEGVD